MGVEKKIGVLALLIALILFFWATPLQVATFLLGAFLAALHFHFLARSIRGWVSNGNEKKGGLSLLFGLIRHLLILGVLAILVIQVHLELLFLMAGFLMLVLAVVWEGLLGKNEDPPESVGDEIN